MHHFPTDTLGSETVEVLLTETSLLPNGVEFTHLITREVGGSIPSGKVQFIEKESLTIASSAIVEKIFMYERDQGHVLGEFEIPTSRTYSVHLYGGEDLLVNTEMAQGLFLMSQESEIPDVALSDLIQAMLKLPDEILESSQLIQVVGLWERGLDDIPNPSVHIERLANLLASIPGKNSIQTAQELIGAAFTFVLYRWARIGDLKTVYDRLMNVYRLDKSSLYFDANLFFFDDANNTNQMPLYNQIIHGLSLTEPVGLDVKRELWKRSRDSVYIFSGQASHPNHVEYQEESFDS